MGMVWFGSASESKNSMNSGLEERSRKSEGQLCFKVWQRCLAINNPQVPQHMKKN